MVLAALLFLLLPPHCVHPTTAGLSHLHLPGRPQPRVQGQVGGRGGRSAGLRALGGAPELPAAGCFLSLQMPALRAQKAVRTTSHRLVGATYGRARHPLG